MMFERHDAIMLLIEPDSGAIVDANSAAAGFYGHSCDVLRKMHIGEINQLPPEQVAAHRQRAKCERANSFLFPHKLCNGSVRLVEVHSSPIDVGGRTLLFSIVHDVTDRNRVETALRDTKERLELAVEGADLGFYDADLPSGTFAADERYMGMLGRVAESRSYALREWFELMHPDDASRVEAEVEARSAAGWPPSEMEYRMRHTSGDWVWILDRGRAVRWDAQGRATRLAGTHLDITSRRAIEEKLRESVRQMQTILNHLPGQAFLKDRQSRYLVVNELFVQYRGLSPEQCIGKTDADLYPAEHAAKIAKEDEEVFTTGQPARIEHFSPKTGRTFQVVKVPLPGPAGSAAGLVGMAFEITDRVRVEQELRRSEERYRNIFENAVEGIFRATMDGAWLNVNPALARMFGYSSPADMIRRVREPDAAVQVHAEERDTLLRMLADHGEVKGFESEFRHASGSTIWVALHAKVVPEAQGKLSYYEGTAQDVTGRRRAEVERHRLEDQLHQAQKMDAVGQLAGGVAHDFNNILSVILSYCGFALEQADPRSTMVADLLEIKRAGERAAGLTRQLLAFSRKQNIAPRVVEVNSAIEELARMLTRLIGEHVELRLTVDPNAGTIFIDPSQFEQILINLAVNARDAMPRGGLLGLTTARTTLSIEQVQGWSDVDPGDYVEVTVSDTGTGMTAEVAARMFEPFFTTKPTGKGTGMGLAIVYGAVKQNRGHIEAQSRPGMGAAFRIYLRACPDDLAKESDCDACTRRDGNGQTILLVEDEPGVRSVTARILRVAGYQVVEACSGEEALLKYEDAARTFDLVVSDVIMPGMGGARLVQRLRELNPAQKIIFTTGYTDDMANSQGSLLDEVKLLYKPVQRAELLDTLRAVIDA
jgi:PAS domain S-box-containing protein